MDKLDCCTAQKYKSSSKRRGAFVNCYLILRKGNQILLSLRKNTGYCDGSYGLVSGHVEEGESALEAAIREAYEEVGICIYKYNLTFVHALHRQSDRTNLDLFFECHNWKGEIHNREPHKCAGLDFFNLEQLPSNTIQYIEDVLKLYVKNKFYSENGWQKHEYLENASEPRID
jgi:8-oxo-dGTP diphosphatase